MSTISKIFAALAISTTVASPAFAGGFIGDLIERGCGGCGVGKALDRANEQLGKPAEQIGGTILQGYGVPLSARCMTPYGVAYGPFLPIGGPCNVNGAWGIVVQ